jgi:Tfp pilus assembly protein PilN
MNINLLPPEKKQYLASRRRSRTVTATGAIIVAVILTGTAGLFGLTLYEGAQVSGQLRRVDQVRMELEKYTEIESLALAVRDRVTSLSSHEKARVHWSKVAEALAATTPAGIQVTQWSLTTISTPHVQLSGLANNKERVASFRERLEGSDRFEQVSVRQVGQTQDQNGNLVTSFSVEAILTGVALPKPATPARSTTEEQTR